MIYIHNSDDNNNINKRGTLFFYVCWCARVNLKRVYFRFCIDATGDAKFSVSRPRSPSIRRKPNFIRLRFRGQEGGREIVKEIDELRNLASPNGGWLRLFTT
ncbi:hypothetical protein MLD38_038911 [Melastoma candidum]|uniref:Uncharacterized protein n=1 Tax=Melastoma candidum TaxID=119954 RepID=A0ACB9L1A1_9MYRT|nr:hypothetical protein MLD38_038911 [Melastoma candidum]